MGWAARRFLGPDDAAPAIDVRVVIPARDEASVVGGCVAAAAGQATEVATGVVPPLAESLPAVVAPVAAAVAPVAETLPPLVTPVADAIAPVVEALAPALAPAATVLPEVIAPVTDAASRTRSDI